MKKMGLLKNDKMNSYELERGYASYRSVIEHYIEDLVLCNNITQVDGSVYDNMENGFYYIDNETGKEKTYDEYCNDENGTIDIEYSEIYQYFICNLSEYEKERLLKAGVILSYSDMLECDVLCVDHFGTGWSYVLTDVKLFDTYEELEAYEDEEEEV